MTRSSQTCPWCLDAVKKGTTWRGRMFNNSRSFSVSSSNSSCCCSEPCPVSDTQIPYHTQPVCYCVSGFRCSGKYFGNQTSNTDKWNELLLLLLQENSSFHNLLSPEKLKTLYSFVNAARHVDCNEEVNEHDDASDICRYFRPDNTTVTINMTHTASITVMVAWLVLGSLDCHSSINVKLFSYVSLRRVFYFFPTRFSRSSFSRILAKK